MKENEKRIRVDFDHSRGSLTLRKIGTILPEDTFSLVFKKLLLFNNSHEWSVTRFEGELVYGLEREKNVQLTDGCYTRINR